MNKRDILSTGTRHIFEVQGINRELIEKTLEMRALAYIANAKADLLTDTIFKVDSSKKALAVERLNLEKKVQERTRELELSVKKLQAMEEELRKTNNELENRVKDRTAEVIKLSYAVEQSPSSVVITDTKGNIEYVNSKFTQVTGYTLKESIGQNTRILKSGNTTVEDYKRLWEIITSGGEWKGELCNKKKNGEFYWESTSISPVKNDAGVITNFISIKEDITNRKKMEKELLKTQKLESLGILAGGIAHDFNNRLAGILMKITLARMNINREDKAFQSLVEAEEAIARTKNLTMQLLTFSQGGAPIMKTSSLKKVIEEAVDFSLRGSRIKCQYSLPDNLRPVEIDEGQMGQVINNLIINTYQAMPKGGFIKVCAENTSIRDREVSTLKAGDYVKVTIEDQGMGIPKERIHKIFDPYYTTKEKGSGLGLAITYSIIKNHGGYIDVESELGIGSTFSFYIPASHKEIQINEQKQEGLMVGSGRVLLMDDDDDVRDTTGELLKKIGYDVSLARNGDEAIRLYKKANDSGVPFDAVILDLTIPGGMGGKETMTKLLEIDSKVKAIVSSGYSNDQIIFSFREHGFSGVLAKPFEIQELNQTLHDLLVGRDE